jgi:hypothetical protein
VIIHISETKGNSPKKTKKLGTQIIEKFNDISSSDETKLKYITEEPLFKNY